MKHIVKYKMSLENLAEVSSKKQTLQKILELFETVEIDIPDFRELSIRDAIRKLKTKRNSLPYHSPDISKIDAIHSRLLKLEYQNPYEAGPYDITMVKRSFPKENCPISDVNEQLLFSKVSDLLEIKYLNHVVTNWNWEEHAKGIVYGEFSRPMISFPVQLENKKPLMVHFRIDTGASNSVIPAYVFEALIGSAPAHIPSAFYAYVGGVYLELSICSEVGNNVDIPVLGQDFLKAARVEIKLNYGTKIVEMTRVA
jgi:hypothetical protein